MAFGKPPAFTTGAPKEVKGWRILIHGNAGTGKTTLAAYAPGAAVLDCENNFQQLKVRDKAKCFTPDSWLSLLDALALSGANALPWFSSGIKSIVIDSLTSCERMASDFVLNGPEFGGDTSKYNSFGRGTAVVYLQMEKLRLLLESHTKAGRHVICIAHSRDGERVNTEGEDTKYIEICLNNGDKTNVAKSFINWADAVACVYFPASTKENIRKANTSARCIDFVAGMNFDAKNRIDGNPDTHTIGSSGKGPDEKQAVEFWRLVLPTIGGTNAIE